MKKVIIFLLAMNASVAFAQDELRLGVHLDPIISWFSTKSERIEKDGTKLGVSGGLIVEKYFRPNYGLTSGLSVTSLGGNILYKDTVEIISGTSTPVRIKGGSTVGYTMNYLTIPIALKLKTNEIGYLTYYAQLGFTMQINISTKATSTGSQLSKDNVPKEINSLNLGYFFGGGFEYNLSGNTRILAGLFYNSNFIDVLSNNNYKALVNNLTVRVGILF
jgi:hypothetical protein